MVAMPYCSAISHTNLPLASLGYTSLSGRGRVHLLCRLRGFLVLNHHFSPDLGDREHVSCADDIVLWMYCRISPSHPHSTLRTDKGRSNFHFSFKSGIHFCDLLAYHF